jgi:hypothetical protein
MESQTQKIDAGKAGLGSVMARLGLVCMAGLVSCFSLFECVNTVLFEVPSPKNKRVATVFERDCGATTAANYQLLIRASNRKPKFERGKSALVYEGSKDLRVEWTDDDHLKVWIPAGANIFRKYEQSEGVQIVYTESSEPVKPEVP